MTINAQLAIASGNKAFTALAVMSLVEQGDLALDSRVRSILCDHLQLVDARVTVEHLLTHRSGIGDYLDEDAIEDPDAYLMPVPVHQLVTTDDYVPILDGHPAKFAPGERFANAQRDVQQESRRMAVQPAHHADRDRQIMK